MFDANQWQGSPVSTVELSVAELRSAITQLLASVEARFGPDLRLEKDFYWNVPVGDADVIDTPPELDLGSVVDDVASVRELLSRKDDESVAIWHEADHLAGVLRSIARLDLPPA